jgi:hypothetical protein
MLIGAVCVLAACNDLPRDPNGTLERVRMRGEMRIGLIHDSAAGDASMLHARTLIARLEQRTESVGRIEEGDAEALLRRVEAGELELVLGRFDDDSPWRDRVAFATPLSASRLLGDRPPYRAAMMIGENAWVGLVENESFRLITERE